MTIRFGLNDEVIEQICSVFSRNSKIEQVIIFGSRAKGNFHSGSDIDLAVKGNNLTREDLLQMEIGVEDLGLLYEVDIIDYEKEKGRALGEHIDRVGELFYENNVANY